MTTLESMAEQDLKRAMQLNKPIFDLIDQIFAPASPDDKRVKAAKKCIETKEDEPCPHDEHDHGICLSCGEDITDDLVGQAENASDARQDR